MSACSYATIVATHLSIHAYPDSMGTCILFLEGSVHYGWLGKSSNSKEVLRINYPIDWRQEHKSPLRLMFGMTIVSVRKLEHL
jgi:hypothetical protein